MLITRPSRMYRNRRMNCKHDWRLFNDEHGKRKKCSRCRRVKSIRNIEAAMLALKGRNK